MTTRTASKILALNLSTMVSIALFSFIVVGMHATPATALRRIELPTVVVIGHQSALPIATAQARAALPKNT